MEIQNIDLFLASWSIKLCNYELFIMADDFIMTIPDSGDVPIGQMKVL